jgi:hypothetical protein
MIRSIRTNDVRTMYVNNLIRTFYIYKYVNMIFKYYIYMPIFQFSEIDIIVSVIVFFLLGSRNYHESKLKNKLLDYALN